MQKTINLGQVVQPSMLSKVEGIVKNRKEWMDARSATFSQLAGEDFTHRGVVQAHAYLLLVFLAMLLASVLEGGAA